MNLEARGNYFFESKIEVEYEDTVAWGTMFRLFLTACSEMVPKLMPEAFKIMLKGTEMVLK